MQPARGIPPYLSPALILPLPNARRCQDDGGQPTLLSVTKQHPLRPSCKPGPEKLWSRSCLLPLHRLDALLCLPGKNPARNLRASGASGPVAAPTSPPPPPHAPPSLPAPPNLGQVLRSPRTAPPFTPHQLGAFCTARLQSPFRFFLLPVAPHHPLAQLGDLARRLPLPTFPWGRRVELQAGFPGPSLGHTGGLRRPVPDG